VARVMIVGLGRLGVVEKLLEAGADLTIVERNEELCRAAGGRFQARIIVGREDDPDTLRSAGLGNADMMIAASSDDDVNLAVCKIAKTEFKVPHVIAVLNEPRRRAEFVEIKPPVDAVIYLLTGKTSQQSG